MLLKYENDSRILWVCGTNYLTEYKAQYDYSYVFTRHTLPCGWASWSSKFVKYYDGYLAMNNIEYVGNNSAYFYNNRRLVKQKMNFIKETKRILESEPQIASWDHQMTFSIMANSLLGIAPTVNLIKNIGVDSEATHGGASLSNIMTNRFCGMESLPINFPLNHPSSVIVDVNYERLVGNIICIPRWYMAGIIIARKIRYYFNIPSDLSFFKILLSLMDKKK